MRRVTRVAISADDNNGLDSVVSPHFGRCPFYMFVDLDDREVQQVGAVENPYYGYHQPGQVPGFIESQGADVMLAGGMGRRAIGLFQQCGIEPVTGATGSVRHALEQYLGGALQGAAPCSESLAHGHEEASGGSEYEEDEAGRLREEIEMLRQQLDGAMECLDKLATG
jgi:predicted Fe-Mo cluster-binding NifX family protein